MKGELCRKCRTGRIESKEGVYCRDCLFLIKRTGLQGRKAFQGHWYDHQKGGGK